MRCALCREKARGLTKTLCDDCHFIKEAFTRLGSQNMRRAIRQAIKELNNPTSVSPVPHRPVSPKSLLFVLSRFHFCFVPSCPSNQACSFLALHTLTSHSHFTLSLHTPIRGADPGVCRSRRGCTRASQRQHQQTPTNRRLGYKQRAGKSACITARPEPASSSPAWQQAVAAPHLADQGCPRQR